MLDLTNATFISAVRIESADRAWNFEYVIGYLCRNLKTNIAIFECGPKQYALQILQRIPNYETKISYRYEYSEDPTFHRTRLLNELLCEVKTDCVINYDCDVILDASTYLKAYEAILKEGYDLVYPYFKGISQKMIFRPKMTDDLTQEIKHVLNQSDCGQVQFFNTKSYIEGGMESENFLSWGAEDSERKNRFITLGYRVKWLDDCYIYHIEHSRSVNSGRENPHWQANEDLYNKLKLLTADELRAHLSVVPYLKKYKKKMITLLTYCDEKYKRQQEQLVARALELDSVDFFITMNREDLIETDFYKENKKLLDQSRGGGFWIWKPMYILEALKTMEPEDILVYMDCGDYIRKSFRDFVQRKMRTTDIYLTEGGYPNNEYTKYDVFEAMGCLDKKYIQSNQVEAGIIVLKNTAHTIKIISEWLKWCLTPGLVDDSPNKNGENFMGFVDNRHDQSILSLLKVFHDIPASNEIRTYIDCNKNE